MILAHAAALARPSFCLSSLCPSARWCLRGPEELISSHPPYNKTPTDESSSPSALPLHPFSSLWHLFLFLTTAAPSLANFHHEEVRGPRTSEWLRATCSTYEASAGLQPIITLSSPVGVEARDTRALTRCGLS